MRQREFEHWLEHGYKTREGRPMEQRSRGARISNCLHVEEYEGDLDEHWKKDRMQGLLRRFQYGREEEARHVKPRHRIPIDGCLYDGTATLASAIRLYMKFCDAWAPGASAPVVSGVLVRSEVSSQRPSRRATGTGAWPVWEQPSATHLLEMARALTPLVRFLHPDIVQAVVEDNERQRAEWSATLTAHGVEAGRYLWPRGTCAFPGVRRYAGSTEIARHRGRAGGAESRPSQALATDDNNYPKHLWSFVLRGRPFQQFGPAGYELAHLLDHKDYKCRLPDELADAEALRDRTPYGLYTCASNAVYLPKVLLRPTDHAGLLRGLLQRRAQDLYGPRCALAPPPARVRASPSPEWETSAFSWSAPVGEVARIPAFLAFRRERLAALAAGGKTR